MNKIILLFFVKAMNIIKDQRSTKELPLKIQLGLIFKSQSS